MSDSMPAPKPETVRRAPRWVWITMIVSLAANLLIIGGVLGALWHFRYVRAFAEGGAPPYFGAFVATLPTEKRRKIDALLSEQRAQVGPLRRVMRAARAAAIAAVTEEPFDKERLRQLNLNYHNARQLLRQKRAELFPEILDILSREERLELLQWRRHRHRWGRWRGHDRDDANAPN